MVGSLPDTLGYSPELLPRRGFEIRVVGDRGERKEEQEEQQRAGYYVRERRHDSFRRSMTLPEGVDENKVRARSGSPGASR